VSSQISRGVFDRFLDRFGMPLRQNYSSSETGSIAVDSGPPAGVRFGAVGRPLPGVDVRIGDNPDDPFPPNEIGRVWTWSPWQMAGYGFPPAVVRPDDVDGWWPMRDLGALEADGRLVLAGRLDDCIRTREGRLVNLGLVASMLGELKDVRQVAVVPLDGPAGASFGAVVECHPLVTLATLRARVADVLPRWAWPRKMALVSALPLLPNRKPDRQACGAILGERVVA
jgi:acyl-CoA synthetase (AMP-forming)/AMP-acid ligase II